MPAIYQGDKKIVDRYVGETLVTRTYQGDKLIFDAYSELSGTLPLAVRSRASQELKNYRIYGESVQDGTPAPDNPVELTGLGARTVNLFNDADTASGTYINSSGAAASGSGNSASRYIPIQSQTQYIFKLFDGNTFGAGQYIGWYDEDKQVLGVSDPRNVSVHTATSPTGAAYMRFSVRSASIPYVTVTEQEPSSYIPYGYKLPLTVRTENLFDYKNAALGYYLDTYAGGLVSSVNSDTSSFIDVSDMAYVTISLELNGALHSVLGREYVLYNENKRRIGYGGYVVKDISKVTVVVNTANASFIRFDYDKSHTNIMLTEGSTPPDHYIPYYNTETPIYIGDTQLMRIPNTEYADYVDYDKGKIVRMIKEYTFTGEESFSAYHLGFVLGGKFPNAYYTVAKITTHFSHFTARSNAGIAALMSPTFGDDCACFRTAQPDFLLRSSTNFTTVEECKAYFKAQYDNGTPVKMWYVLETPVEEDPPVPLPDITLPRGEATIDIEGNLKPEATVKGRINPTA